MESHTGQPRVCEAGAVFKLLACSFLAGRSLHSRAVALADDEEENTRSPQRSRPAGNQRFTAVCSAITSPAPASLATSRSSFSEPHSPPAAVACPLAVDNGPYARCHLFVGAFCRDGTLRAVNGAHAASKHLPRFKPLPAPCVHNNGTVNAVFEVRFNRQPHAYVAVRPTMAERLARRR